MSVSSVLVFSIVFFIPTPTIGRPETSQPVPPGAGIGQDIALGVPAAPHAHPWLLSIELVPGALHCGASLMRVREGVQQSDIGLTAAHCMCGNNSAEERFRGWYVVAGKHLTQEELQTKTKKIVDGACLPCWDQSVGVACDVSVFKFDSPVEFNDYIKPIDLPKKSDVDVIDDQCVVAGWGATGFDSSHMALGVQTLQELNLTLIPPTACKSAYTVFEKERMICTHGKPGTPCVGDSGGPLSCHRSDGSVVQKGIVGFGHNKCSPNYPASFTRVLSYMDWIQKKVQELTSL